jgi:hypothetical protein
MDRMTVLALLLFGIFLVLALLHFNWALGGEWGFDNALPTNENGDRLLNPRKVDSLVVGLGLLAFAMFYLLQSGIIRLALPEWIIQYGGWLIPLIFILRAIGDFKYVGFFKKIKQTPFGQMDTKYFSPLCLLIGVLGIILQVKS